MTAARDSRALHTIHSIVAICLVNICAQAGTSRYVFVPDRSTLVQTGGLAGVQWTYTVQGQFLLTVDSEAGTALFAQVDANAVDDSPFQRTLDPNEVFNLTALSGTVVDGGTWIRFEGHADDGSSVLITLTFANDTVHLKGQTTPPPNSADFFIFTLDAVAQRKYSGGTGEPNDPYQIATAEDLMLLGESTEDYHKHFILTADIDLDPNLPGRRVFDRAVIAAGRPFRGVFDGKDHTISNLTIIGENYIGLFGVLNYGAMISNLSLVAIDINGKSYIGGLVGVNGYWGSGGLINYCYSTGVVNGDSHIGGLVGVNEDGSIIASYSTATVGGGGSIGGLVGENGGTWSVELDAHITECYSGGVVTGNSDVGGLVGSNYGIIARCYSLTTVTGESSIGGLVGGPGGQGSSVSASFWDMEASGQATSAAGTGLTTAEMTMASTFLNAGWDFVDETLNGTCDYWQISLNNYPRLSYHLGHIPVMPEGTGTSEEPYLIRDARDLGTMCLKPMAHYRLEMSVDLSGTTWSVAVVPWFEGTFDGNTHVIRNLHIEGGGRLGLFGRLVSGATVSNLGLEAVDVSGSGKSVGALVGQSEFDCSIMTSYSSGFVNGNEFVGGLVGINRYGSNITSCYSTGSVGGNGNSVGGLVGSNGYGSNITSCYSTGSVGGNGNSVGGLVGSNYYESSISSSYSSCVVTGNSDVGGLVGLSWRSDITASFWDIETSGQTTSAGGIGKTTAEMQTASTFLDAGWDFVDETANGPNDVWKVAEGLDYPRIWWEPYDGQVTLELGQIFAVTLESNPSTGYGWEWVDSQESTVEQVGEAEFVPRETGDPPLVGAGGWEIFNFKAVNSGQMTLELIYRRPWEEGVEPLKTFSLQVTIP